MCMCVFHSHNSFSFPYYRCFFFSFSSLRCHLFLFLSSRFSRYLLTAAIPFSSCHRASLPLLSLLNAALPLYLSLLVAALSLSLSLPFSSYNCLLFFFSISLPTAQDVMTLEELVVVVRATSEALVTLAQLSDARHSELLNAAFRQRLLVANETLRKSAPLLVTALRTFVQSSANAQAKAGRDYAVDQVVAATHEIIVVVTSTEIEEARCARLVG